MTQSTATLTDFLLARIDEDEAAARSAHALYGSGTHYPNGHPLDPARVLVECEAKRRIVSELRLISDETKPGRDVRKGNPLAANRVARRVNRTLHALAEIYADHPDYRQEWKP